MGNVHLGGLSGRHASLASETLPVLGGDQVPVPAE
jgi:hypothetical protein